MQIRWLLQPIPLPAGSDRGCNSLRLLHSHALSPGALYRLGANLRTYHLGEVAGLRNLAELDESLLHPGQLVHGQRQIGRYGVSLYRIVEHKGRTWIIRLGVGCLDGKLDRLVTMGERVAQRLRLCGQITDRVLTPRGKNLSSREHANAHEI